MEFEVQRLQEKKSKLVLKRNYYKNEIRVDDIHARKDERVMMYVGNESRKSEARRMDESHRSVRLTNELHQWKASSPCTMNCSSSSAEEMQIWKFTLVGLLEMESTVVTICILTSALEKPQGDSVPQAPGLSLSGRARFPQAQDCIAQPTPRLYLTQSFTAFVLEGSRVSENLDQ